MGSAEVAFAQPNSDLRRRANDAGLKGQRRTVAFAYLRWTFEGIKSRHSQADGLVIGATAGHCSLRGDRNLRHVKYGSFSVGDGGRCYMDRYFETELGRVLGFYDFSESASVVPPHIAGNTWFTESHEQTHLRLASSTAFGFLQRLVALVARKSSPGDHEKSRFSELFRLLLGCSFNVHEGAANYYPLKGGGARQFQDVV